jgi:hypothetical protein
MFRNPFGKKSLFGKATQIASILPIPGAGLIGKAFAFANRARSGYEALSGRVGPILTAGRALTAQEAPIGVMPGGARVGAPRKRRAATTRRAARNRAAPRSKKRKLKFGSPAWRAKYMRRR